MSDTDLATQVQTFPLLQGISSEGLNRLLPEIKQRSYPTGQTLLMEDAWGNAVYLLLSGWVKVRRTLAAAETALAVLGSPSFFGEMAILDVAPRATDVVCLSPVEVMVVSAVSFNQLLQQEAPISYRMAQSMAQRLRTTNQRFALRQQSPAIRFVFTLVQLGEIFGEDTSKGKRLFNIPLQDLADLAVLVGAGDSWEDPSTLAAKFIQAVRDLRAAVGIADRSDLLQREDFETLTKQALAEGFNYPAPRLLDRESVLNILGKIAPR